MFWSGSRSTNSISLIITFFFLRPSLFIVFHVFTLSMHNDEEDKKYMILLFSLFSAVVGLVSLRPSVSHLKQFDVRFLRLVIGEDVIVILFVNHIVGAFICLSLLWSLDGSWHFARHSLERLLCAMVFFEIFPRFEQDDTLQREAMSWGYWKCYIWGHLKPTSSLSSFSFIALYALSNTWRARATLSLASSSGTDSSNCAKLTYTLTWVVRSNKRSYNSLVRSYSSSLNSKSTKKSV